MKVRALMISIAIFSSALAASEVQAQPCVPSATHICLNQGRFDVSVQWKDFQGNTGPGRATGVGSDEAGLFWFFSAANWEMLVKVLNGCGINNRFWVYAAATTNVEFTLTVRDTSTGISKIYRNASGVSAPAITDSDAFATCTTTGLPPDPGPAGDATIQGVDSDGNGVRDDVQRYIALTYPSSASTRAALTQMSVAMQKAMVESSSATSSLANANQVTSALECLATVSGGALEQQLDLAGEVIDTEQRLRAYLRYDQQLSGQVITLRKPAERPAGCDASFFTEVPSEELMRLEVAVEPCAAPADNTALFFVNGVLTTEAEARVNLMVLQQRLQSSMPASEFEKISFNLNYNRTHHLLDFFEVVIQWANQQGIRPTLALVWGILRGTVTMSPQVTAALQALTVGATVQNVVTQQAIQQHVGVYRSNISEGRKVLVVAHSQGNFFANSAYQQIPADERPSFGIVAVATPANSVGGNGPYTTIDDDWVIGLVPGHLAANVSNGEVSFPGHSFVDIYLVGGSPSLTKIRNDVRAEINLLDQPPIISTDGVITVTLTWGNQPDVDLHAFEPNGEHVYYVNPNGQSGELDVDDVSGFGPEHYTVACDTLEVGTYRVGVNYYRGSSPETASVRVEAGNISRNFQKTLSTALGSGGNANPVHVANIVVTRNSAGIYSFSIQ